MGQLGGQLAHDFNNVLAVTLTSVEVAMRVGDQTKANTFLANAIEVIQRGRTLTDRMAAVSQACQAPEPVDAHASIRELVRELEREDASNRTPLVAELDATRHTVMIDAGFLQSALRNLATNAREAMADGGTVTFSTRNASGSELKADKSREYVVIAVKDSGGGMSEDVRHRAFDLFFSTKTSPPWRGTGLAQVKDTARRAGGMVAIESEVGRGTTVELALPLS